MNKLSLFDGMKVAYKEWGAGNSRRILALHGWLDNANSFNKLGPFLAENDYHIIAIDHLGHGHSSHIEPSANYGILKSTAVVREVFDKLNWESADVIGHSMGAFISLLFSATHHERVKKLILIDGLGPLIAEPEDAARNLRKAIDAEINFKQKTGGKVYPSFGDAVKARMNAVKTFPGNQFISLESVLQLVGRGTKFNDSDFEDITDESIGPVRFRHDPRMLLPSYNYHTKEQVYSYMNSITSPTLLIIGEQGWPLTDIEKRKEILSNKGLLESVTLPGSHHLHLDPHNCELTAKTIIKFLSKDRK